jgi:hypothetical protein
VRLLIDHVRVTVPADEGTLEARVHWSGGEVTSLAVARGRRGMNRYVATSDLIELLRGLAQEFSDAQIARILNRRGLRTPKGLCFTAQRVAVTRNNHGIENGPLVPRTGEDVYTALQAAEILGVNRTTVIRWVETGLLKGTQLTEAAPWRIRVSPEDIDRLKPTDVPEGWVTLKKAALVLGVGQQAVVQRLNRRTLEAVRIREGRRSSWRIRLPATAYDQQATLFDPARSSST